MILTFHSIFIGLLLLVSVAQAINATKEEKKNAFIVADDTIAYILLLYHCQDKSLTVPMKLQSDRAFIDIYVHFKQATDLRMYRCYIY